MTRLSPSINALLEDIGEVMKGVLMGSLVVAGGAIGWATAPVRAMPFRPALSSYGSSQQVVSPVPASIAIAGELRG